MLATRVGRAPDVVSPSLQATAALHWRTWPAAIITLAVFLFAFGAAWDIQWHQAIGRDSVFIPPHDLMLAGIAIAGLCGLTTILVGSFPALRRDDAAAPFLQVFRAPLGAYLAGFGALSSLIALFLDDYWHQLHGIDTTLWAPFHVMLALGMDVAALGAAYLHASALHRARKAGWRAGVRGARAGLVVSLWFFLGLLLVFNTEALDSRGDVIWFGSHLALYPVFLGLVPLAFVAAPLVLDVPLGATAVAVTGLLLRELYWWAVPIAVRVLADAGGYTYRPQAPHLPLVAFASPTLLIVSALLVDGVAWLAYRRRCPLSWFLGVSGVLAALLATALNQPWQQTMRLAARGNTLSWHAVANPLLLHALPYVILVALLASALGVRLGRALRVERS